MAASRWPTEQLFADSFVNCAGCILFAPPHPETDQPTRLCVLHYPKRNEWLLPKGRQDRGEGLPAAAVRETFEETGVRCELLPVRMRTRAPPPPGEAGPDDPPGDHARTVEQCTEPFAVSARRMRGRTKFIWWFVARAALRANGMPEAYADTQMADEHYEPTLCYLDIDLNDDEELNAAVSWLTYEADRDIVKQAIRLVCDTYPEWFPKTVTRAGESEGRGTG